MFGILCPNKLAAPAEVAEEEGLSYNKDGCPCGPVIRATFFQLVSKHCCIAS